MTAIGQLFFYLSIGASYFLLFVMTAPLIAKVLLKIYFTGYWYPIIVILTIGLLRLFHVHFVSRHITFSSQINVGNVLIRNIGKSILLLALSLIYAQILYATGIHEGKLF